MPSGSNQGQRGLYIKTVASHQRSALSRTTSSSPTTKAVNAQAEATKVFLAYLASRERGEAYLVGTMALLMAERFDGIHVRRPPGRIGAEDKPDRHGYAESQ